MELCDYQAVNTDDGKLRGNTNSWKYFFRQFVISIAVWAQYFTAGLALGTPTVLIPQWMKENNVVLDYDVQSWIYACPAVSATPFMMIVPTVSAFIGRKIPYIISSCSMLLVFGILYFSTTPNHILISEAVQGLSHACNVTITVNMVSEYVDPKYRGLFLTIKSASFFWGMWAANAIGTFCHWRYIPIFGVLCTVFSLSGSFHPESPNWLASRGRFDEARAAFRWTRGWNERTEKELGAIIESYASDRKDRVKLSWDGFVTTIKCRQFYVPLSLSLLMVFQYHLSGKLVCSVYAVDIMKRVIEDEKSAYTGMLILDGVTVLGMYIGSFISKILKRRTLYITASLIGVLFLLILAAYLFLVKLNVIADNNIVSIILLTVYSVSISCGPMILSMTVTGEIIPAKYLASCYTIQATVFSIIFTLSLKFTPLLFNTLGMDGSFLFYGLTSGMCLVLLYFYLPETKDKTLLEIEEYFKDKVTKAERKKDNESLNSEDKTVF